MIIGNLTDWTVSDNLDGTKCLERIDENGQKVTINRALIHPQDRMIEPLETYDVTKMYPYSINED